MIVREPTPEERALLKLHHSHRFPELRYFPKAGDDGRDVRLPVVLGNPSGACKLPDGERPSKAWNAAVLATYKGTKDIDLEPLVADCVLWPDAATWASWVERWPALPDSIYPALARKYGGSFSMLEEPTLETAPAEIAKAQAEHPGSSWVRLSPKPGDEIDMVIAPPTAAVWGMFTKAMERPGADVWALALDFAQTQAVASSRPASEVFSRWPGFALLVAQQARYLAGLRVDYEEGEL